MYTSAKEAGRSKTPSKKKRKSNELLLKEARKGSAAPHEPDVDGGFKRDNELEMEATRNETITRNRRMKIRLQEQELFQKETTFQQSIA